MIISQGKDILKIEMILIDEKKGIYKIIKTINKGEIK